MNTSETTHSPNSVSSEIEKRSTRPLVWTAIISAVAALVAILFMGYVYFTPGNASWQILFSAGSALLLIIGSGLAIGFARKDKADAGAWVLIVAQWTAVVAIGLTISGTGQILGLAGLLATITVAVQTLPQRTLRWVIIFGVLIRLASGLLIFYRADWQTSVLILEQAFPIIGYTAIGGFVVLILLQLRALSVVNKLVLAFLIFVLVATTALSFLSQNTLTQVVVESLGNSMNALASARAQVVAGLVDRQINSMIALTLNNLIQQEIQANNRAHTGDSAAILGKIAKLDQQWQEAVATGNTDPLVQERMQSPSALDLKEFQQAFPSNIELFVTDRYGALVATSNITSDYYQADEAWWQAAYANGQGAVYISQPEFDESANTIGILMALPVRDRETGELIGILRSTYLLLQIEEILNIEANSEHEAAGHVDLYFPGPPVQFIHEGLQEATPADIEAINVLQGLAYGQIVYDEQESLVSQSAVTSIEGNPVIDQLGWYVVAHQELRTALQPVRLQQESSLLVTSILLGVLLAAGIGVAQVLAGPINRLTEVANRVRQGELSAQARVETRDEIGLLANTFNEMTANLQSTLEGLEQRVAERTRALETSVEVSRRLSTILDLQDLLVAVVEEVQRAFGYYHAHIYLFDESGENLVMAGGTGEAGQTLLQAGHKIPTGRGLVGKAAQSNQTVLVMDTRQDPGWLPNPLLPETKSEVALPIAVGERVLGVLDVQQNVVNALTEQDAALLQSIASQVAIAIQNAQLFSMSQQQAERETLVNLIGQRVQTATSVEGVLQIAVGELAQALGASQAGIQLDVRRAAGSRQGDGRQQ